MSDLIDRDKLFWNIDALVVASVEMFRDDVLQAIQDAPSIPAEVVRHGRWEERTFFNGCTPDRDLFCSCCNHDRGWYLWEYCPYCGARMDGQGEGDSNG